MCIQGAVDAYGYDDNTKSHEDANAGVNVRVER